MLKMPIQDRMKALLLIACLFPVLAVAAPWDGQWEVNYEETDKVTETYKEGSGIGRYQGHTYRSATD